jgi:glycosyltransferase involved in cell wall biosynthesis
VKASVVHVFKDAPPVRGGIEGHIDTLTRLLVERGVAAEVLCSRPRGTPAYEERAGVRIRRCAAPLRLASTPLPPALPWALRRSPAEIVHLHYPWPPGEVAWLLGGRRRPLVVTVHCEVLRYARLARQLAPLTERILAGAAGILVSGPQMARIPLLAGHAERVRVVPHGVELDRFHPDRAAEDPLPRIPHPRIVFVGRLRHYKGLSVLASALARLPDAHLVVVGEGPERGRLEQSLRAAGCSDRAHLLGEVDDAHLVRVLQTSDAAVLPSDSPAEAFGLSMAEAQACGVPGVITDVGTGTAQTLADTVSGRVVPAGDDSALAEALAWCLDPARAAACSAAARAHAEAHLCARRMAAQVHAVYEEVMREAHARALRPHAPR